MKAKTKWKVGDVCYAVTAYTKDGRCTLDEWIVTSIRRGNVVATLKAPWTWGKRSTKQGDFGFKERIPSWCRLRWNQGEKQSGALHTTPRGAWKAEADSCDEELELLKADKTADFSKEIEIYKKIVKTCRSMETKTTK